MKTWPDMPAFDGTDLGESFVLGWEQLGGMLRFSLAMVLVPGHSRYVPVPPHLLFHLHPARLEFTNVRGVVGLAPIETVPVTTDADGSRDFGNIDGLEETPTGYRISGQFGDVFITTDQPVRLLFDDVGAQES